MAGANQMIEKHEDSLLLQRRANGNETNADDPRRPSSSIKSFQKITRKVMSRSSTGAHQVAQYAHSQKSNAISNGTSKDCHNLVTQPVPSFDDGSRRFSHHTTSSAHRMAANNGSTQQYLSDNKALDRKSLQTARSLHYPASSKDRAADASLSDHRLISKHGSSTQFKSSSIKVSHRSSSENLHTIVVPAVESALEELSHTTSKSTTQGCIEVASKHRRQKELCKDCKISIMASVCFINNDGRIAAALTHPSHYCKKPGCAANRGHYPSASTMSKKASVSNRQVPPMRSQPTKTKSLNLAKVGDGSSVRSSTASSTQGSDYDSKHREFIRIEETCISAPATSLEGDHESQLMTNTDTDPHNVSSHHQNGVHDSSPCRDKDVLYAAFPHSENLQCLISRQIGENHEANSTPVRSGSAAASCLLSDVIHDHDGVDEIGSVERDAVVELQHDCKSLCYHGDNEYSCSEDGTDVTTTPNSLVKGAFDNNASSCHVEEHVEDQVSQQSSKSSMARMRRKYLETLRDQQEAERVRLRKQEIMARKQAGDWMLDCHMEELLHRLAPNGEARVKVLVEAFETVIHHSDSENSQTHQEEHNQPAHDEQEEQLHTDSFS